MQLKIGSTVVPRPSRDLIAEAYRYANGTVDSESPWRNGWGWGYGWWGGSSSLPLWYAQVNLWAHTHYYFDDAAYFSNGNWWGYSTHVMADDATAKKLDAEFAGDAVPEVLLSDGDVKIRCGISVLQSKTLLRDSASPHLRLWAYAFVCFPSKKYRTTIQRQHAWKWADVMEDTYPKSGRPITDGPTLANASADTLYVYGGYANYFYYGYSAGFDVQLDSGCRFGQGLELSQRDSYELQPARFWTLEEAQRVHDQNWKQYADRIGFGGRIDEYQLAGMMPAVLRCNYTLLATPGTARTFDIVENRKNSSGRETLNLGQIKDNANLEQQLFQHLKWEAQTRRNQSTTFTGLVPWAMTPLDTSVRFCLPIEDYQPASTIVSGTGTRYRNRDRLETTNPAKTPNKITVTFTRILSGGFATLQPAGGLERIGGGTGPDFGEIPVGTASRSYVYENLPDGEYRVQPGTPWVPTSRTVSVAGGQEATMSFTSP